MRPLFLGDLRQHFQHTLVRANFGCARIHPRFEVCPLHPLTLMHDLALDRL
ncbi:MAG: hypothetical protein RLO06_18440 [Parvibaculum sp.]